MIFRRSLLAVALAAAPADLAALGPPTSLEWIGAAELPRGATFEGVPVGGLSSIAWDPESGEYLAVSDDRSELAPARVMRLRIGVEDGRLEAGEYEVIGALQLADREGREFPRRSLDPEGFALAPTAMFVGSEGEARVGLAPWVSEFDRAGRWRRDLPLPGRYLPDGALGHGLRNNLGFESLALSPDGAWLFAATESALIQDGPEADVGVPSPARVLRWRLGLPGAPPEEFVYRVEPISVESPDRAVFRVNGLVDLLALSDRTLLALERQFVTGVGIQARLYRVELDGATEVSGRDGLLDAEIVPVTKTLLLDFAALGVYLDNLEGIALGPRLPDGRRALVVISDDNFAPEVQVSQVFAFAVDDAPLGVAALQGAGHRSPLAGRWVAGIEGTVTAVVDRERDRGFWLESERPDGDARTSEGIFVTTAAAPGVVPGDAVRVGGRLLEIERGRDQLSVTTIALSALERRRSALPLPPPARVWNPLLIPNRVDDDALSAFEPESDAIDFWESLEGMRVELPGGVVASATRSFGDLVLLPDPLPEGVRRTVAGGAVALAGGGGPLARVTIGSRVAGAMPEVGVGGELAGPIAGVVDYAFSTYKLQALVAPTVHEPGAACAEPARLHRQRGATRIASFNLYNLSAADPRERFERLAEAIVGGLGSPALVALQEVQDDDGSRADAGVVTADGTLGRLVDAVARAGGPSYQFVAIDPELDREGGEPGGNIRVALLLDPARVRFRPRGAAGPLDAVGVERNGLRRAKLTLNPGRVAPRSEAFGGETGEGVRRSLAVEVEIRGQRLFVIVNHWSSKYEDDRAFGAIQPPRTPTAARRLAQAREIRAFVAELLEVDPRAKVVVIGDFNDVVGSEPIDELGRPPLTNLVERLPEETRYTFNFEGGSAAIDHIAVSPALAAGAEIEAVHLNADCPDALRSSDHDPLVARFRLR
ncbi:MAG: hypothetical protein AMXMBFR36_14010 [Acidobacteriota bacterium]